MVQSYADMRQRLAQLRETQTILDRVLRRIDTYKESQVVQDELNAVFEEILELTRAMRASHSVVTT